jgi:hypothetical protein
LVISLITDPKVIASKPTIFNAIVHLIHLVINFITDPKVIGSNPTVKHRYKREMFDRKLTGRQLSAFAAIVI